MLSVEELSFRHSETLRAARRWWILRILDELPNREANLGVVSDGLRHYGIGATQDVIRTDLAWLQEQGYLQVRYADQLWIPVLTARGAEVAAGTVLAPGVARVPID